MIKHSNEAGGIINELLSIAYLSRRLYSEIYLTHDLLNSCEKGYDIDNCM